MGVLWLATVLSTLVATVTASGSASSELTDAIAAYIENSLGYRNFTKWRAITTVSDTNPSCLLCAILSADYALHIGDVSQMQTYLGRAQVVVQEPGRELSNRERAYFNAYQAWLERGDLHSAYEALSEYALESGDEHAVKRAGLLGFLSGRKHEAFDLTQSSPHSANQPYFYANLAFAAEQAGRMADAEAAAEKALRIEDNSGKADPWAHHAYAHILLATGRNQQGADFLQARSGSWQDLNVFLYTHNWWHLAIFEVNLNHVDKALSIFDEHVWGPKVDKFYVESIINAVGLLWKLEIHPYGLQMAHVLGDSWFERLNERWKDVARHVSLKARGPGYLLYDFMALHALQRAGESGEAAHLLATMSELGASHIWIGLLQFIGGPETANCPSSLEMNGVIEALHPANLDQLMGSNEQLLIFPEEVLSRVAPVCRCTYSSTTPRVLRTIPREVSSVWHTWVDSLEQNCERHTEL